MNITLKSSYIHSIIVLITAVIFSSFTLWLVDSWIKYPLLIFEIFFIFVLYLILTGHDIRFMSKLKIEKNLRFGFIFDLALVFFALLLILFYLLDINLGLLQTCFTLLCTSFFSGYSLLNVTGFSSHFSKIETIVFSFITSYAFSGLTTFLLLSVSETIRVFSILSIYIIIGLISYIRRLKVSSISTKPSFSKKIDVLPLLLVTILFVFSFCFMYPEFSLLPGTDISRHYSNSIILTRTPDVYTGSNYLFAHLHQNLFLSISNSNLIYTQTALVLLNLLLPIAFYIMAKPCLEKIDLRLPALATIFWILFTNGFGGFAWIYFTKLKLFTLGQTHLQLIYETSAKTYDGVSYGVLGLWYVPATISLILFFAAIFLIFKKDIPQIKFIMIFSIIIFVLYLTHLTFAVILVIFIALLNIFYRTHSLRLNDSLKASLISLLFVILVYALLNFITSRFLLDGSLFLSLILTISASIISILIRKYLDTRTFHNVSIKKISKFILSKKMLLAALFIYGVAFFTWFSVSESFTVAQVGTTGLVPWFLYPLMLGVNGVLALVSLYVLDGNSKFYKPLTFFITFLMFTFIFGRLVSIINVNFFDAGYWEKRFIWLIKIPLAIIAPISLLILVDKISKTNFLRKIKTLTISIIIATLVLSGISTTFLNLDYWNVRSNTTTSLPSSLEMDAITSLKQILEDDPYAWLITVTETSSSMLTFAAPADQIVLKKLLYEASTPETALIQLYRHLSYSHPYIYIHTRDIPYLKSSEDNFLMKNLQYFPIVFENAEVTIYNCSKLSYPQYNSKNMLLIPYDSLYSQNIGLVYNALSNGFYNYSVAYDIDQQSLDSTTIILPIDPPKDLIKYNWASIEDFNQLFNQWSKIKGYWEIRDGKLSGGTIETTSEGIILSKDCVSDFNSTISITPKSSTSELNYMRLIYSWIDSKNYRLADFLFSSDSHVYLLLRNIIDGVEENIPSWPGLKTNLTWVYDKQYNFSICVNNTQNEISINGESVLSTNLEHITGSVGLGYLRFEEITFDEFSINYTTTNHLRSNQDYLRFLNQGGEIIVINTNDYGFFSDELFSLTNSKVPVQKIIGNNSSLNLPSSAYVSEITLNSNVEQLSYYDSLNGKTPFILLKPYENGGKLFYVNIYPIIQSIQLSDNKSSFNELLSNILGDLGLSKMEQTTPLSNFDAYVKEIHLFSDSEIETSSIIFPFASTIKDLEIRQGASNMFFKNVTDLSIKSPSNIKIEMDNLIINGGNGLYTPLKINSTFNLVADEDIDVRIKTTDGLIDISGVTKLSITPEKDYVCLARTPTINTSCVDFIEFYPQNELGWQINSYGQNLNVVGSTQFSIILADKLMTLTNVAMGETIQYDPPIVMYDELSTLPVALFWSIILAPIFVGMILLKRKISKHNREKYAEPNN